MFIKTLIIRVLRVSIFSRVAHRRLYRTSEACFGPLLGLFLYVSRETLSKDSPSEVNEKNREIGCAHPRNSGCA